jgi:uncharacterized RDD family membrane protein YckC
MAEQGTAQYGGFWIRFLAYLVDGVILMIAVVGLLFASAFLGTAGALIAAFVPFVVPLAYFVGMQASARQATFGKALLGLKVGRDGERLSILRSLGRELAKYVSAIPLAIGFLIAAFTSRKQALHDLIASTTVVREGPSHVVAALAIALVGFLAPIILVMVLGAGILAAVMGGAGMGLMSEMMKEQGKQAQKSAPARPAAPAPAPTQAAPAKPAAPAPAASSTAAADVDKVLVPVTGVDKPGAVRAGPALLELSTFFAGGDPKVWIRVHVPQAVSRAIVVVNQVADGANQGHYDPKHSFESAFFQAVSLSDSAGRKEGLRSVNLTKGTTEQQVQKIDGVLRLQVPVGTRTLILQGADAGKDQSVGSMRLKLNSIKGDAAEMELQGSRDNVLQLRGLNAKGEAVPTEMTSWGSGAPVKMTTKFKGPVDRVELQVAAEIVERSYPFTLTRGGAAAAVPAPKPVAAPALVAAKPAPAPAPAPAVAPAPAPAKPVAAAPAEEAPKPKPAPRKRAATPKPAPETVAAAPAAARPAAPAPAAPVVLAAPRYSDLMSAVMARDAAGVQELLAFGKWADKPDRHGSTPLMVAVGLSDAASAEVLLKAGANADKGMVVAQERRDPAMTALLQRYGATLRRP